jgi:hypothetical protein
MAMTQDEIRDFWKLGASLSKIPEDVDDPQVVQARMAYERLKAKMVEEVFGQKEESTEEKAKLDVKTAFEYLEEIVVAFKSLTDMIPQLAREPNTLKLLSNAKLASEWLHENIDSLKNSEK